MMYNDVDTDLPPFNDPIDGDEIFLFSNTKTSLTGASFLHEDDDDHLRQHHNHHHQNQHHHNNQHHNNVVASTSSHHLPVDVDELLLNSNFLEQQNCDTAEDPLFWNCKDISDDQLNEIWPQSQLNLSSNNINTINSINNINHHNNNIIINSANNNSNINNNNNNINDNNNKNSNNNNNNISNDLNSINNCLNQTLTLAAATSLSNCNNITTNTQHNGIILSHQQPHVISQLQQQTLIPMQTQQLHNLSTLISQPQLLGQHQQQHIQLRLHQQQQSNSLANHHAFNSVLHSQQQQQSNAQIQQQQTDFHQPQQIIQHLDQYQNKWITVVQGNDHYQTFNTIPLQENQLNQHQQVAQFFEKLPQTLIQADNSSPAIQITTDSESSTATQSQLVLQAHPQRQPIISSQQVEVPPAKQEVPLLQTQAQQQHSEPPFQGSTSDKTEKKPEPENTDASKKEAQVKQNKPKERQTRLDCPYCKRSFSKNFDLQQHMRCHTGEKPFQCIVCGRGFAQKSNVKKHMQAHKVWPEGPNNPSMPSSHVNARSRNNSASSSICLPRDDECMQENESVRINNATNCITNNGNALGPSNDRKHDGNDIFAENRYSCSYCQFNGRTYFELKSHLTIHKREKVFKCIVSSCGKTFSGSDLQGFLDHVTGHKDLIYHCHLCSGQFYSLDEFGEHQKHHSNAQMKKSAHTQSSLPSNQSQQLGQILSRPVNTSLRKQNQQVVPPTQLQPQQNQRQYNQQPSNAPPQSSPPPPPPPQQQQQQPQLQQQQRSQQPQPQSQQQPQQQQPQQNQSNNQKSTKIFNNVRPKSNQKYFRCSKCMNRYTTQTALDHHLSISTHNFPCTECNKVFMCERYLRRHLNTHTAVQHVCTFCDKQFKTAAYLKMHSVVHTGEKPFQCNQCEAAFNRRDKLSRHKLTHETVKKFKCPFRPHIGCTKEFNRPDKLKAHVLTHSGVRPHPCDLCSRTFSRLSRLREHKKLHHVSNNDVNSKSLNSAAKASASDLEAENENSKHNNTNNIKLEVKALIAYSTKS